MWPSAALMSYKHLPRPVKEWANRGLEFTDAGLGIGERFDMQVANLAKRSPGLVYEQTSFGSVSLFRPGAASHHTKQVLSKHMSTEVHKMGGRWKEDAGPDKQMPAPGTYEIPGFVDEMKRKTARRPKGKRQPDPDGGSPGKPVASVRK